MTGSTQISSSSEGKILQVNLLLFSIWLFETPWTVVRQASLSFIVSQGLLKLMPIQLVMPSNHRILCHPLLLLPSVFNLQSELALCIRWPKYWNFNLSISPSNEYSGLIFFRINWFDLLGSPRDSQESSPIPQFKSINSLMLCLLYYIIFMWTKYN